MYYPITHKVRNKNHAKRLAMIIFLCLAIIGMLFFLLEKTSITNFTDNSNKELVSNDDKNANTTSKVPSAQNNFNGGSARSTETANKQEGVITDQQGRVSTDIPVEGEWSHSANNTITVYTPSKSSLLTTGQPLSGATTIYNRVSFRLSDNISGVIASGSLAVVNGKFSGNFDFSTNATEGRVDVFMQNADGIESNHILIPVRFK